MEIIIIILLILLNGLFAMSEIALISARRSNLTARAKQGNTGGRQSPPAGSGPGQIPFHDSDRHHPDRHPDGYLFGRQRWPAELRRDSSHRWACRSARRPFTVAQITHRHRGHLPHDRLRRAGAQAHRHEKRRTGRQNRRTADAGCSPRSRRRPSYGCFRSSTAGLSPACWACNGPESKVTEAEITFDHPGGRRGRRGAERSNSRSSAASSRWATARWSSIMTHRSEMAWIDPAMTPAAQIRETGRPGSPTTRYPAARRQASTGWPGVIYLKDLFTAHRRGGISTCASILASGKILPRGDPKCTPRWNNSAAEQVGYGIVCDEFGVTQRHRHPARHLRSAGRLELPEEREEPDIVHREDGSCLIDGQCPFLRLSRSGYGLEDVYPNNALQHPQRPDPRRAGAYSRRRAKNWRWNGFTFEIVDMDGARIDKILACETSEKTNQNP